MTGRSCSRRRARDAGGHCGFRRSATASATPRSCAGWRSQRPAAQQSPAWIDRQRAAVIRALDLLEHEAETLEGLVTIGTLAVACALGYLDLRFADEDWRAGRPKLAAWYATIAQRPSLRETVPPGP